MKSRWILIYFVIVIAITFVQHKFTAGNHFLEPSLILLVLIARTSPVTQAIFWTIAISVSLDLVFAAGQVKGLGAMVQMALVYIMAHFKKHIIPSHWDLFVLFFFALFYLLNYYGTWGLSELLGLSFDTMSWVELVYRAVIHTLMFGAVLLMVLRFSKDTK